VIELLDTGVASFQLAFGESDKRKLKFVTPGYQYFTLQKQQNRDKLSGSQ